MKILKWLPILFLGIFVGGDFPEIFPTECFKGIKCLSKNIFICCEKNDSVLMYAMTVFGCGEGNFCDEQDPFNGCVPESFYVDQKVSCLGKQNILQMPLKPSAHSRQMTAWNTRLQNHQQSSVTPWSDLSNLGELFTTIFKNFTPVDKDLKEVSVTPWPEFIDFNKSTTATTTASSADDKNLIFIPFGLSLSKPLSTSRSNVNYAPKFGNVRVTFRKDDDLGGVEVWVDFSNQNLYNSQPSNFTYKQIIISNECIGTFTNNYIGPIDHTQPWTLTLEASIDDLEPGLFTNVYGLHTFEAILNPIKEIKFGVFTEETMTVINLRNNEITDIDNEAFDNMPNLEQVDLSGNKLTFYNKNWFSDCPNLQRISLASNQITILPVDVFANLNLGLPWSLNFDRNPVEHIDDNIFGLGDDDRGKGVGFSVRGAKLKCLSENFDKVAIASTTTLIDNVLSCDCQRKIYFWNKEHPNNLIQFTYNSDCSLN